MEKPAPTPVRLQKISTASAPIAMAAAETPDARPVLEEVIVTAEKRSENIQDVPASAPSSVTTSDECKAAAASGDRNYRTPTGSFASKTECTRLPFTMTRPLTLGWAGKSATRRSL